MEDPSRLHASIPTRPAFEPVRVLSYVVEPRASSYRAIMAVFAAAKRRYVIQLRPAEVLLELRKLGIDVEVPEAGIEDLLDQLVAWGNLRRNHDTASAQTLEEFQRRRAIYVLTPEGEAAEQAVGRVVEALERSGSLQKVMFGAILEKLRRLRVVGSETPEDSGAIYRIFFELFADFAALTENASIFLSSIQQALDTETYDTTVFQAYKYAVVEYLERFIDELNRQEDAIVDAITRAESLGLDALIGIAAKETEAPTPDGRTTSAHAELLEKWQGLRVWFVGDGKERPLAEGLRTAATGAIARMLRILNHLNEQRFRRVSRVADFMQLAAWFESIEDEREAHALFRDAFGLAGPRHLLQMPDEEEESSRVSWFQSRPVEVPWATRARARPTRSGRPARREDYSEAKRRLEEARREREAKLEAALAVFVGQGRLEASKLSLLTSDAMEALLDYVDACLTTRSPDGRVFRARSHDGRFSLTLEWDAKTTEASISSVHGKLHARNFFLTVEEASE